MSGTDDLVRNVISQYLAKSDTPGVPPQPVAGADPTKNPLLMQSNPVNTTQMGERKTALFGTKLQDMKESYAKVYPWLAPMVASPEKLMSFIDTLSMREARRYPGTGYDGHQIEKAKSALTEIYGINNYTPKGFVAPAPTEGE